MKYQNFSRDILRCDYEDGCSEHSSDSEKGLAAPKKHKQYSEDDRLVDLVEFEEFDFNINLQKAIKNRRTRRKFTDDYLTLKELSFLLWSTQGVTDSNIINHRAVPSASATHPFETYLAIKRVKGVSPGIYRYLPAEHKLCVVYEDKESVEAVTKSCFEINEAHMEDAAVAFIWAAMPYRAEWRFGPHAYKFIAIDAGHICQNLYLAAEAIHAGTCSVGIYDQKAIDKSIGVNGKDEFVVYMASVGRVV